MIEHQVCQSSGDILYKNGKSWSGAGVIVTENYRKKNGDIIPCIILAKDIARNKYNDFGGQFENRYERLSKVAHHELREESANLLNISAKILRQNFVDSEHGGSSYRSYFIKVKGISNTDFENNVKTIKKNNAPSCWLETSNLVHVPIDNIPIINLLQYGDVTTKDIDGNEIIMHNRARQCIVKGYDVMLKVVNGKSCASAKDNGKIHKSKRFTNGTFTIKN